MKKGYTLIELLIVLGILFIVLGIFRAFENHNTNSTQPPPETKYIVYVGNQKITATNYTIYYGTLRGYTPEGKLVEIKGNWMVTEKLNAEAE